MVYIRLLLTLIISGCWGFVAYNQSILLKNNHISEGGAFIIASLTPNGIVIASESRHAFFDGDGKVMAYYDHEPKVFQHHQILVAVAGNNSFEHLRFSGLFKLFNQTHKTSIALARFYGVFKSFAAKQLNDGDFKNLFDNNVIIIAGFNGNEAIVKRYCGLRQEQLLLSGYFSSQKNNYLHHVPFLETAHVDQAVVFSEGLVKLRIKAENKDTISKIGGPVTVVALTPSGIHWIDRIEKNNFSTARAFADALLKENMKMWFRSPADEAELRSVCEKYVGQK